MESVELPHHFLQHDDQDHEGEEIVEFIGDDGDIQEVVEYEEWVPSPNDKYVPVTMEEHEDHEQDKDQEHVMVESYVDEDGQYYEPAYEDTYVEDEDLDVTDYDLDHSIHADDINYVEFDDTTAGAQRKLTIVQCEVCGAIIKHPSKIQAHMRTHTGEKPYECQICGLRFTQKTPMINHYRKHVGDMPYSCGFGCGKKFVNNAQKNAHELRHRGVKRQGPPRPHLKPPKRSLDAVSRTLVKRNRGMDRILEEERCPIIDWQPPFGHIEQPISAASSKRLDEVIEAVAAGMSLQVNKQHNPRSSLLAQCQVCGLMLKHPSKIQAHMRTHTGEKPFKCDHCGLRFATLYPLKMHVMRKHTGDRGRKIPCTWECGMNFISIGTRNEHERIVHAGWKRYECTAPGCRRMFTRRRYLMVHRAKEHSIYVPVFDPHEITESEMMLDSEMDGGNTALYTEEISDEMLNDDDRVLEMTAEGMVVIPEGHFLEGEFVDDGDHVEYIGEEELPYSDSEGASVVARSPSDDSSEDAYVRNEDEPETAVKEDPSGLSADHTTEDAHEAKPSTSNCSSTYGPQSIKAEPIEGIEETVKHVWMDSGAFQPRRKISVRILKRSIITKNPVTDNSS